MPIYEYICPRCGLIEELESIDADVVKICPGCKEFEVRRVISYTGYPNFQGNGFYENEYKKKTQES